MTVDEKCNKIETYRCEMKYFMFQNVLSMVSLNSPIVLKCV